MEWYFFLSMDVCFWVIGWCACVESDRESTYDERDAEKLIFISACVGV